MTNKLPDNIIIEWHIEDIKSMDGYENMTDDECRQVLQLASRKHDANIGINWDVLRMYADEIINDR